MKDYRVQVKIKNNYMLFHMELAGLNTASALARATGVYPEKVGDYLNLKKSPLLKNGQWSKPILRISEVLKCLPEDLFPPQHIQAPLANNTAEFEVDLGSIAQLMDTVSQDPLAICETKERDQTIHDVLQTLRKRDREIIMLRMGLVDGREHTFAEIAKEYNTGPERIRQIEARALRFLRHPCRARKLRPYAGPPPTSESSAYLEVLVGLNYDKNPRQLSDGWVWIGDSVPALVQLGIDRGDIEQDTTTVRLTAQGRQRLTDWS